MLLQIQDYALLAGSLALLGALAAVMFFTRRVDWYGRAPGSARPPCPCAEADDAANPAPGHFPVDMSGRQLTDVAFSSAPWRPGVQISQRGGACWAR